MVEDPVCRLALEPSDAAAMVEFEGRGYYFCSPTCQERFLADPENFAANVSAMRLTIGVMGAADDTCPDAVRARAAELGRVIAHRGFILVTGACPGLPLECARGARELGGWSVGISPALSLDEHVHRYRSPADAYDVLIFTGSGLMGREVTNIRSSDMVAIIGGRSGTLGEFAIAYDEGKLIGVLEGSGGIADRVQDISDILQSKPTGARVVRAGDPATLLGQMVTLYTDAHFRRPSCFCSAPPAPRGY